MATATRAKHPSLIRQRRRSAYELRAASMASQILARYRRTSLHDTLDSHSWGSFLQERAKPKTLDADEQLCCSHRSSLSTDVDEEDQTPDLLDDEDQLVTKKKEDQQQEDDENDYVAPLPEPGLPRSFTRKCSNSRSHHHASSATELLPPTPSIPPPRRRYGTVLRELPLNELYLFREEAEYSDYLNAIATGAHIEMDSVVFYEVEVHLSQSKWTVLRRFSEFRALRKRLLKHLAKRQRLQGATAFASRCMICDNILQTIEQAPFPSRKQQRKPWFAALRSRAYNRKLATRNALVVADRKKKLHEFVSTCLATVRGLRQHSRLMCDSSACEIGVALRMIEEFLGLSFTRYMRFLAERGVVDTKDHHPKTAPHKAHRAAAVATHRTGLRNDPVHGRRATVAV